MKNINTEIPDDLKDRLALYSQVSGLRIKKIIELAIAEYLNRREKK